MQMMDWESEEDETSEGMVGTFVNFGNIGAEFVINEQRSGVADSDSENDDGKSSTGTIVQHQDDVFILLCPQNMVGNDSSIIPWLQEMVEATGDRPVILINPDLTDRVSAAGQQSVRGRQQRMDFASSFEMIYHWQNIYVSGTSYFPILGPITKLPPEEQWIAYQRRDFRSSGNGEIGASDEAAGEIYVPVLAGETKPTGQDILEAFEW
jgi:adenylate kinase